MLTPKPLKPGMKLDRYLVAQELGSGGMGTVWKAVDESIGRNVAIKALHVRHREDENMLLRFRREPVAMGRIRHPNVAQVILFEERDDLIYYVMEYIEGKKLSDLISDEFRLSVPKAVDVFRQIASALIEVHKSGIIHRDLKPANVMIESDGRAVLMDFGLSKIDTWSKLYGQPVDRMAALREFESQETPHRGLVGTPAYLAPERWLGRDYDHRIDIYSFGAMMYHAITGETPYGEEPDHNLMTAHIKGKIPSVSRYAGPVPEMLEGIIERCMAKEPDNRYSDAGELHDALGFLARDIDVGRSRIQKKLDDFEIPYQKTVNLDLLQTVVRIVGMLLIVGMLVFALVVMPLIAVKMKMRMNEKTKEKGKKPHVMMNSPRENKNHSFLIEGYGPIGSIAGDEC